MARKGKIDVRFRARTYMLLQELCAKTKQPMSVVVRALVERSLAEIVDDEGYIKTDNWYNP